VNHLEPISLQTYTLPSELVAQCRALHDWSAPLLLAVDRREPPSARIDEDCLNALSAQEQERQRSFRQTADRERFVLGRGLLRLILGAWLSQAPRDVNIEFGPYGKPFCTGGPEFNLSHSGDLILLGLHPCRAVGVDVERIDADLDWQLIAQRLWTQGVIDDLRRLPAHEQSSAFFHSWCQYEAISKAHGWGLLGALPSDLTHQDYCVWSVLLPRGYKGSAVLLTEARRWLGIVSVFTSL
jgi:4'-phosphopantetheinyl transferase